MSNLYFLNFVEEGIQNMKYVGYTGGRIEVSRGGDYPGEEIRFFTKKSKAYNEFRKKWDFKYVSQRVLAQIKEEVKKNFNEED